METSQTKLSADATPAPTDEGGKGLGAVPCSQVLSAAEEIAQAIGSLCAAQGGIVDIGAIQAKTAACIERHTQHTAIRKDKERMDWIENEAHALVWDDNCRPGVHRAEDGVEFFGESRREAIDAAMYPANGACSPAAPNGGTSGAAAGSPLAEAGGKQ